MPDALWNKAKKETQRLWEKAKTYIVGLVTVVSSTTGCTPPPPANNTKAETPVEAAAPVQKQDDLFKGVLAEKLAESDAAKFAELQGKHVHSILSQIEKANIEYDQKIQDTEKMKKYAAQLNKYKEECGYRAERAKLIKQYQEAGKLDTNEFTAAEEALEDKYKMQEKKLEILAQTLGKTPIHLTMELCGFAAGTLENYCQAIQKQAAKLAARDMKSEALGKFQNDLGWTCQFAKNTFQKNGFGTTRKIADCYVKKANGQYIVNKGKDGKPLVKDGDLALLLDKNGNAWHCVRLNVSENGNLTYSAGNEERNHASIFSLRNNKALIIPTRDYAKLLAAEYYRQKTLEELQTLVQQNNIAVPAAAYSLEVPQTASRSRFAGELKREAKHTLDGTLPPTVPPALKQQAAASEKSLEKALARRAACGKSNAGAKTAAPMQAYMSHNAHSA